MIVRIFNEDQYRVPADLEARVHELDAEAHAAVAAHDETQFHATYAQLLETIRKSGERLGADSLEPSDLMLPPADITLEEAQREFTGDGLIPD